ncbi:unnamed protein product, partial [Ascophyllum nodosum]
MIFYDLACRRLRYLQNQGDLSWEATTWMVDRFHFETHTDAFCLVFTNPEDRTNPFTW